MILYRQSPGGRRHVVKRSEVALGDLRSPLGPGTSGQFIDETASWMIEYMLDGSAEPRSWFETPAATELPMGTPGKVDSLGDRGSPFGFATGARRARRAGEVLGGEPVRLIAPAGKDPDSTQWVEVPTGRPVADDEVTIANYGEELVRLVLHPESKMLGPGGQPCRYTTRGLLFPRAILVAAVHTVGKEGNRIEEVATGEVFDPDEVLIDYGDDSWEVVVLPVLRDMGTGKVAARSGMERARVSEYLTRRRLSPPAETLEKLGLIAQSFARDELSGDGSGDANGEGSGVLARYLAARERIQRPCALPGCNELARRWPSVTCSERHRKGMARLAANQQRDELPPGCRLTSREGG